MVKNALLLKNFRLEPSYLVPGTMLAVLFILPIILSTYYIHLAILILMYAVLGTAWNWIGGFAGQISLGNAVYFGIGAYTTTCTQLWWGWNPWVGLLTGTALAAVAATLIGLPCFRLKGHYFAIATIAVGEIVNIIFTNWEKAGGAAGMYLTILKSSFWQFQFSSKVPYYYIILVFLVIATGTTIWLKNSRSGFYFRAIKENPDAAKALGINLVSTKLMALILSALATSAAGAFWANYVLFIDPESVFSLTMSTQIALIVVMGGMGTIWGPLIGTCIIVPLSEGSRMLLGGGGAGIDSMVYGGLIMLVAVYQPGGIMGAIEQYKKKKSLKNVALAKAREGGVP